MCTEIKEFNYLLKVDPELFTHDIERTKTYEEYENELNDEFEEPWYNKASNNSDVQDTEEQHNGRFNLFNNTTQDAPVCKIRIFEMIKYSFRQDEEYVAIKECEYDDLTRTNEDACRNTKRYFVAWTKDGW
ncbi:hypothetical protein Tco_1438224 [Tanacetum coccineum]